MRGAALRTPRMGTGAAAATGNESAGKRGKTPTPPVAVAAASRASTRGEVVRGYSHSAINWHG